jgi:hypothetical protein
MRKILAALAVPAGVGAIVLMSAGAGFASNGPVKVVTHIQNAQDTTSGTTTSVQDPRFGPVWAYDNITKQFTVTHLSDGSYQVDLQVHGSFDSFSDPNTGLPYNTGLDVTGSIDGVNTYWVDSPNAPNPAAVPGQEADNTGTGTILSQMFGGTYSYDPAHPASGNLWVFTYKHAGNVMTQRYDTAPSTWGDVVSP